MRRIGSAAAAGGAVVAAALALFGGAAAQGRVTHKPAVRVGQSDAGPLLVDGSGYTVFLFTRDKRNKDRCAHISGCETDWPAVTTTGPLVAGAGIKRSLLGTIPFHGRVREVTYAGHPLHTYKFDFGKGSTMNIGNRQFGGSWFALTAAGKVIK